MGWVPAIALSQKDGGVGTISADVIDPSSEVRMLGDVIEKPFNQVRTQKPAPPVTRMRLSLSCMFPLGSRNPGWQAVHLRPVGRKACRKGRHTTL